MSSNRVRAAWIAPHVTTADPDPTGAAYTPVRFDGAPEPVDATEIADVGNATGRNEPNELTILRSGARLDLAIPFGGYAASSGDGVAVAAADATDIILANGLGVPIQETGGEGVGAASLVSNVILDAAIAGLVTGGLLPVYLGPNVAPLRALWRRVGAPAVATYPVIPDWPAAPTTDAIAYGVRAYGQDDQLQTPTQGLAALVEVAGRLHRLLNGRVSSLAFDATAGKKVMLNVSLMFDSFAQGVVAAARPAIGVFPAPMIQTLAPFYWNGVAYPTKSVKLNMGLKTVEIGATEGANGRAGYEVVEIDPVLTIAPAWAPAVWTAAFAAGTIGEVLAQLGGGVPNPARLNSGVFHGRRAQVMEAPTNQDDAGYLRQSVQLKVLGSGGAGLSRWRLARC